MDIETPVRHLFDLIQSAIPIAAAIALVAVAMVIFFRVMNEAMKDYDDSDHDHPMRFL